MSFVLRLLRLVPGLPLALALMTTAEAATVMQTAPADIGASLREGEVTVVLFWSPDPRCGYCRNEDKAFDTLAKGYGDHVVFRRVQWSPWTAFPALDLDIRIKGIPNLYVFRGRQATAYMQKQIAGDAAWVKAQIDNALKKIGKQGTFVQGMRITDEETMEVVEWVLGGEVQQDIVMLINHYGGQAVGLTGKDGGLIRARKMAMPDKEKPGEFVDIGFVGEIEAINPAVVKALQDDAFIPIISPIGFGQDGQA
ncbi:MAG: hypothetical protein EOP35_04265, partial [Rubrivivax sp.]